jgi:hypothetical protein
VEDTRVAIEVATQNENHADFVYAPGLTGPGGKCRPSILGKKIPIV